MQKLDWIQNKIMDTLSLMRHVNIWRAAGKKIVFTNGCFDILHRGHLDLLAKAAQEGNILVVGLNTDSSVRRLKGEERPLSHEKDRCFQLASLLVVDAVCLFNEDTPQQLIELVKPDVLVKGGDYKPENIVGSDFVATNGGKTVIIPFVEGYSTTNIINRIKEL